MSEQLYTFLPIAPCTFTVLGVHHDAKAGTPIKVPLPAAKIMASTTFPYRKYFRVITPLPKEASKAPLVEKKKEVKSEGPVKLELSSEPEIKIETSVKQLTPEEVKELEEKKAPKTSRRKSGGNRRRKVKESEEVKEAKEEVEKKKEELKESKDELKDIIKEVKTDFTVPTEVKDDIEV